MGRTLRRIVIMAVITVAAFFLLHKLILVAFPFRARGGTASLSILQSQTDIHFPQNTCLVKGHYQGGMDYEYFALTEFDAKYTNAFIKSIHPKNDAFTQMSISRNDRFEITNNGSPLGGIHNPSWWKPDSIHKFIAIKMEGAQHTYLLISLDNRTRTKVYLFHFTT